MNVRQLLAAWALALAVLIGAVAVSAMAAPEPAQRFDGADLAAIGSSLTAHALPEAARLGDGRNVRRIGINMASEHQLLVLLDSAITEGVPVVLLEASSFLVDFQYEPANGCAVPAAGLREAMHQGQVALVDRLRRLVGLTDIAALRTSLDGLHEPGDLDQTGKITPREIARHYPLRLHPPCERERLMALAQLAKARGVQIVLVLYPRAPAGEALLGSVQSAQLRGMAQGLADQLGVPLFAPDQGWNDAQFADQAHLNRSGRARFMMLLEAQLANQR